MTMKEFMYLFRGGDVQRAQESPEARQAHMQKWGVWMKELAESGNFIAGLPLHKDGKVVEKAGGLITDGPYTEGKEIVGGYLIVKANDLDHATELSKGCPIYEHGGSTEVREILPMDG
jgi:hypothetical protein